MQQNERFAAEPEADSEVKQPATVGSLGKRLGYTAAALGVAAAGYGAIRLMKYRTRQLEQDAAMNDWITNGLRELELVLQLGPSDSELLRTDVEACVRSIRSISRSAVFVTPRVRELISIGMEKRFLKMKLEIHKHITIKDKNKLEALTRFYEGLRLQLFRLPALQLPLHEFEEAAGSDERSSAGLPDMVQVNE